MSTAGETPSGQPPGRVSQLRLARRVQFYETDMAGVVHFSWYFRYMEEAEHALWRSAGLSVAGTDEGIAWPRVAASFEYRRPLRFEDEFEVAIRVATVAARTITFTCEMTKGGELIAKGQMTVACVSHTPGQPMKGIQIPAYIADRFEVADGE